MPQLDSVLAMVRERQAATLARLESGISEEIEMDEVVAAIEEEFGARSTALVIQSVALACVDIADGAVDVLGYDASAHGIAAYIAEKIRKEFCIK